MSSGNTDFIKAKHLFLTYQGKDVVGIVPNLSAIPL
jgi:hypothetical protein